MQKRHKPTAKCFLGEGKVEEIKGLADTVGAGLVVFDRPLTPPQIRNLEKMTGRQILDRTGVILEIFARHARTNAAKTQVEIAQLEYMLPRMTGAWTHLQRQSGRGMGEKQIEVDRRRARERIARLQKQLEVIRKDRQNQRKGRRNELKVAIVGYTNSGKTTLMNGMTKAHLQAEDALFATLDASVRTLDPSTRPKILLSDTVGFIRSLPHSLIESFRSTLDEVLEADLLLHVVDVSHDNYKLHMETTEEVLNEIGAGNIPRLVVFNKFDRLQDPMLPRILKHAYPGSICASALSDKDVISLRQHIFSFFEQSMQTARLAIPMHDQGSLSLIYKSCMIVDSNFEHQDIAIFDVRAAAAILSKLSHFIVV